MRSPPSNPAAEGLRRQPIRALRGRGLPKYGGWWSSAGKLTASFLSQKGDSPPFLTLIRTKKEERFRFFREQHEDK
ncbi:hypothetical protein AOLI_G00191390 [Acnodon oligacanthus]